MYYIVQISKIESGKNYVYGPFHKEGAEIELRIRKEMYERTYDVFITKRVRMT